MNGGTLKLMVLEQMVAHQKVCPWCSQPNSCHCSFNAAAGNFGCSFIACKECPFRREISWQVFDIGGLFEVYVWFLSGIRADL